MPERIRPLHDNVIILRAEAEEKTPGGLIIPDQAKDREKPARGKVLAAGPGRRDDRGQVWPLGVAPGDSVLFSKYSGTEIKWDGKDALVMTEREIFGVVVDA